MSGLLPKPRMRYLLARRAKILGALGAAITAGTTLGYWYFIAERRTKIYAEFYRTYDPHKEYEAMKKAGVFQCVGPDDD